MEHKHEDLRYNFKRNNFLNSKIVDKIKTFLKKFTFFKNINHFFYIFKIRKHNIKNSKKMKRYFK